MMIWAMLHPKMTPDLLGYIPTFLSESDPRQAKDQIHANYRHGGGWDPFKGFQMNKETYAIKYPGDPWLKPLASTRLRDELILYYDHSWIAIIQPDQTWEIARID